jgi:tetratricopeptide (TPR) repeat protein
MRLPDLVRVKRNSEIYNRNGPSQEIFYGESWLLVHYLFDHQLIDRAELFFNLMAAGTPLDDAIRKAFGTSRLKLENELLSYATGERFMYFSVPLARDPSSQSVDVQPLTEIMVAALKAEVRWYGKVVHSAEEIAEYIGEFKSLLSREPDNSVALRGLGLALLELKDYEGSLRYLGQAVESDPKDVQNHHSLSLLLSAIEESGSSSAAQSYSSRSEAEACVQLDPSFADAYRLIAFSFERGGEFDKAENMMRKAVSLSPRSESYELNLANIELTRHEYGTALALLRKLARSSNPEIAARAEYLSSNIKAAWVQSD